MEKTFIYSLPPGVIPLPTSTHPHGLHYAQQRGKGLGVGGAGFGVGRPALPGCVTSDESNPWTSLGLRTLDWKTELSWASDETMHVKTLNKLSDLIQGKYYYYPIAPTLGLKNSAPSLTWDVCVLQAPVQPPYQELSLEDSSPHPLISSKYFLYFIFIS